MRFILFTINAIVIILSSLLIYKRPFLTQHLSYYFSPVFVMILSPLILKEKY